MSEGEDLIFFTVVGARDLEAHAELGKSVTVSMAGQKLFCTSIATGEAPQWNESHQIPVSGPRSFSIAIHRESHTDDTLLGEIKDIILASGPPELTLPIDSLAGGRPIIITISIRRLGDMPISMAIGGGNLSSNRKHLLCLSDFIVKSISAKRPGLPDSAVISVAIIVNGNCLYETTPVKKEPPGSRWSCNGKIILSSGIAYTLEARCENLPRMRIGFVQLNFGDIEEKQVMRTMAQYTDDDPHLEVLFNAKFLRQDISDTLSNVVGRRRPTPGPQLGISHDVYLQENNQATLNSNHLVSTTLGRHNSDDVSSLQTIDGLANEDVSIAIQLKELGDGFIKRFQTEGSLTCLDSAIDAFLDAVQLLPAGHPFQPVYCATLGMAFNSRFQQRNELSDLHNVIVYIERSASLIPGGLQGSDQHILVLFFLGLSLQIRFERLGEISDIDKAISFLGNVVVHAANDHPDKAKYLAQYGEALGNRFTRLGTTSDLEKAISAKKNAVDLTPTGHPNKAMYLNSLGSSYDDQFKRLGAVSDLEKAISAKESAVGLTPTGHPDKPKFLNDLGNSYRSQFERLGEISDLQKAISTLENAVELMPTKPLYLSNLGNSYLILFERLGKISDLEKGISAQENAVELTPAGDPKKAQYLISLGISYHIQFERLGAISVLEGAISAKENAIELTPTGHPDKAGYLSSLGNSYRTQYERLGEISDLEKAVSVHENAVELTPTGHPDQALYLNNLGTSYYMQFIRLGQISALKSAISVWENAVGLTPTGHPGKPKYLNNLAISYYIQSEMLGDTSVLEKPITTQVNAVELTPTDHPNKAPYLNNLANLYHSNFQRQGKISDLEMAISAQENAIELTPADHPDKAGRLNNLGNFYKSSFQRLGEISDLTKAIDCFSLASQSSTSPPIIRFWAAVFWARCAEMGDLSPSKAYDKALHHLPHVAWIGLTIPHRYTLLSDISDIVHEAAAAAISSGHHEMALEWLEQGRSIVWGQLLHLRTPVDDLLVKEPELATQLLAVSQALDKASGRQTDPGTSMSAEKIAKNHHLLASQWDNLIQKVCLIPGFEGFLNPKTVSQLIPAAQLGPVIVITIHETGCHALALQSTSDGALGSPMSGLSVQNHLHSSQQPSDTHTALQVGSTVVHIPLPNFSYEKAQDMQLALKRLCKSRFTREAVFEYDSETPQTTFEEMLSDLWTLVVLPILDGLALSVPINTKLHHIWWCPTGPLAFLPIHAAGIYNTEEHGHKLSDFAVSSYTPTIAALLNTQPSSPPMPFKILAISQALNPGKSPLPNTDTEVEILKRHAGQLHVDTLQGAQATLSHVIQGMSESTWVHLACHGTQNHSDPTKSAFILADGDLELSKITKMSLPQSEFAFLSACQTATGDVTVREEAVHLAAGMLIAGYRSVVATMWAIRDQDAPQVADDVYAEILRNGQPDYTRAAYALHHATQNLRRRGAPFRSWVPFIHLGR